MISLQRYICLTLFSFCFTNIHNTMHICLVTAKSGVLLENALHKKETTALCNIIYSIVKQLKAMLPIKYFIIWKVKIPFINNKIIFFKKKMNSTKVHVCWNFDGDPWLIRLISWTWLYNDMWAIEVCWFGSMGCVYPCVCIKASQKRNSRRNWRNLILKLHKDECTWCPACLACAWQTLLKWMCSFASEAGMWQYDNMVMHMECKRCLGDEIYWWHRECLWIIPIFWLMRQVRLSKGLTEEQYSSMITI